MYGTFVKKENRGGGYIAGGGFLFAVSQFLQQLKVLMWKNFLLKIRNPITLILELCVPLLFIGIMVAMKSSLSKEKHDEMIPSISDVKYISNLDDMYKYPSCKGENLIWRCMSDSNNCLEDNTCQFMKIAVAPSNQDENTISTTKKLFHYLNQSLSSSTPSPFEYFDTDSDFINEIEDANYGRDIHSEIYSSAIIMNSGYPTWDYSIRLNMSVGISNVLYEMPKPSDKNIDIDRHYGDDKGDTGQSYLNLYVASGYFELINLLNSFISAMTCMEENQCDEMKDVSIQIPGVINFPNKKLTTINFWSKISNVFALLMILALLLPVFNCINTLVNEKETKIREGLMMMSCRADALWVSWYLHFQALFLPLAILLMLVGSSLFTYSSSFLVFIYFYIYFVASLSLCILVSTFFSSSRAASVVGASVFFCGYIIYLALSTQKPDRNTLMIVCLHPAAAFTYGTLAFTEYEDSQIGVTFNTWNTSNKYNITFQDTLTMMLIDALYLLFFAWYFANVSIHRKYVI